MKINNILLCDNLPKKINLQRQVNRYRAKDRPSHPTDLDFILIAEHVPSAFLKADIRVGNERHLIMATDNQLRLLSKAKTWFVNN